MILFKDFRKENTKDFTLIELYYSVLHRISHNPNWYCRLWKNGNIVGEGFGKTKFAAYRLALTGNIIRK